MLTIVAGVPDIIIYYLITQYLGMGITGIYLLYRTKFKIGYLCLLMRRSVGGRVDVPHLIIKGKIVDVVRGAYVLKPLNSFKRIGGVDYERFEVDYDKPVSSRQFEYVHIAEKEFNVKNPVVTHGKGTYHIDLTKPCYRKNGYTIYPVDIETGSHLIFGGEFEGLPPEVAQRHLKNGALRQLLLDNPMGKTLLIMFVVVAICIAVSCVAGGYLLGMSANKPVEPVAQLVGGLFV